MSRLVDIDEVIRVAENTFPKEDVRKIMWVLCHTPTTYDVSKVVAELEKQKSNLTDWAEDKAFEIGIEKSIDIVKRGGIDG